MFSPTPSYFDRIGFRNMTNNSTNSLNYFKCYFNAKILLQCGRRFECIQTPQARGLNISLQEYNVKLMESILFFVAKLLLNVKDRQGGLNISFICNIS